MEVRDVPRVTELLVAYQQRFHLAPLMDNEDVTHWLLPRSGIVDTYVVQVC